MSGVLENLRVVDPALSELALGYHMPGGVADVIFPRQTVNKEAGVIPIFGKEEFKVYNTERAVRGDSNVIVPEARTTTTYALKEYDAVYPIDYREIQEDIFNREQHGVRVAQKIIELERERAAATLAFTYTNFPSGSYATPSTKWNAASGSTPISDIDTGIEAIRSKTGVRPNVAVFGPAAWNTIKRHDDIVGLLKYNNNFPGRVTRQAFAEVFELDQVVVGEAITANTAGTFSNLWADHMLLAYIDPNAGIYEPKFGHTLTKAGNPVVDKYDTNGGKIHNVRSTDLFEVKMTLSVAGYLIYTVNT